VTGRSRRQRGVNLVELIVAIVIISIATVGVLLVYAQVVRFSADPMIQQQAVAIGEAYLDEILARPYDDPNGGETGGPEAGETRATYDDVQDYANLGNNPPLDQNGVAADFAPADGQPDLAGFAVNVAVTPGLMLGGIVMAQIDVRVRFATVIDITLTGYRAKDLP
jgi:MSHA pilin protein MshD